MARFVLCTFGTIRFRICSNLEMYLHSERLVMLSIVKSRKYALLKLASVVLSNVLFSYHFLGRLIMAMNFFARHDRSSFFPRYVQTWKTRSHRIGNV